MAHKSLDAGLEFLMVAVFALVIMAAPIAAQTLEYDHNGSRMQVMRAGQQVQITYQTPRDGIAAQGAGPGTVLFTGELDANDYLSGMARIFRRGCGVIDYYVYGEFTLGRDFTLTGAAPVLAQQGCRIVDNVYEGPNAKLGFTVRANIPTPLPTPASVPSGGNRFCVDGIALGGQLNMRTGPGTQFGVIAQIPASSCRVLAAAPAFGGWQPVAHDVGFGWVASRYLRAVE